MSRFMNLCGGRAFSKFLRALCVCAMLAAMLFGSAGLAVAERGAGYSDAAEFVSAILANPGGDFALSSDLDLTGVLSEPIPSFSGTLRGNGYTIKYGMTVARGARAGLFGINSGDISNLTIDVNLTAEHRDTIVGGLCAENTGNLSGIIVRGNISAPKSSYVGGVAGLYTRGKAYDVANIENFASVKGADYVGGIIGALTNSFHDSYNDYVMELSNLANHGAVVGSGDNIGGLMGAIRADNGSAKYAAIYAENLSNTGNVIGKVNVGGLFGTGYSDTAKSYIDSCDNTGASLKASGYISNDGEKFAYVGGYVGRGFYAVNCVNQVEINYRAGGKYVGGVIGYCGQPSVSYEFYGLGNEANVSGSGYVGGIAGCIYSNCHDSYNDFAISLNFIENNGAVSGNGDFVGGIVGSLYANNESGKSVAVLCESLTNTGDVSGKLNVGGLIGYGYSDTSKSRVYDGYCSGGVSGNASVGCVAGWLVNVKVDSCDNSGASLAVSGYITETNEKFAYAGGYVGRGFAVTNCVNHVDINYRAGGKCVGGVIGYCGQSAVSYELSGLGNEANISGANYVGGIAGAIDNSFSDSYNNYALTLNLLENNGAITGGDYVGGIIGSAYVNNDSSKHIALYAENLANTGAVSGKLQVGGLLGSGYSDTPKSYIMDSRCSGSVSANAVAGCVAGHLHNIYIDSCDNAGASISASGYISDKSDKYAYVGGYVGYGFYALNCVNQADIDYRAGGMFVGGVMGLCAQSSLSYELANLGNVANISGNSYVGGVIGGISYICNDSYNDYTLMLSMLENSGAVTGGGDCVGGVIGYMRAENTTSKNVRIYAEALNNIGAVSGKEHVGGVIGYAYSDNTLSYVKDSFCGGSVEGDAVVGCLAGELDGVYIDNCDNSGASLSVNGFVTVGYDKFAYAGGYAGKGFYALNCVNYVDINYQGAGACVGGIFGCLDRQYASYSLTNLRNEADIMGASYVGGIAGMIQHKQKDSYAAYTLTFVSLENNGAVAGAGDYVGGLMGMLDANNESNKNTKVYAESLFSAGDVSGNAYVGGLIGYASTDSAYSVLLDYGASGSVFGTAHYGAVIGFAEKFAMN